MLKIIFVGAVTFGLGTVWVSADHLHRSASVTQHTVFMSVVDGNDIPKLDLKTADFRVQEDGVDRRIIQAELATDPIQTVLSGGLGLDRVTTLVKSVPIDFAAVSLAGNPNEIVADCDLLTKIHAPRPVVLADFDDRGEISIAPGAHTYLAVEQALKRARASLWVLVQPSNSALPPPDLRREIYEQATRESGGRFVLDGLTSKDRIANLGKIREMLFYEYRVIFERPDAAPAPATLAVKVTRPGTRASAPSWPPQ